MCGVRDVFAWYVCGMHGVFARYVCGVHGVFAWYVCGMCEVFACRVCGVRGLRAWCVCGLHTWSVGGVRESKLTYFFDTGPLPVSLYPAGLSMQMVAF